MTTRTYGWLIDTARWANCEAVTAHIMAREGDAVHPINPRSEGESTLWDAPARTNGLMLKDFIVRTYLSTPMSNGGQMLIGPNWEFESLCYVDTQLARKALHSCRRVEKALAENNAREGGDYLMAIGRALGLTWYVERVGESRGHMLTYDTWRFGLFTEARDKYRAEVDKLRAQLPVEQSA